MFQFVSFQRFSFSVFSFSAFSTYPNWKWPFCNQRPLGVYTTGKVSQAGKLDSRDADSQIHNSRGQRICTAEANQVPSDAFLLPRCSATLGIHVDRPSSYIAGLVCLVPLRKMRSLSCIC